MFLCLIETFLIFNFRAIVRSLSKSSWLDCEEQLSWFEILKLSNRNAKNKKGYVTLDFQNAALMVHHAL